MLKLQGGGRCATFNFAPSDLSDKAKTFYTARCTKKQLSWLKRLGILSHTLLTSAFFREKVSKNWPKLVENS